MSLHPSFDQHGVGIEHHFGGGVYAKEARVPAGVALHQHAHPYPHLSIISQGVALIELDGVRSEAHAPACLTIPAGVVHKITAVTPVVWYCIHATNETDPEKVDASILNG